MLGNGMVKLWTLRTPQTERVARYFHAMAYDSTRNVVVLFGGRTSAINDQSWEILGSGMVTWIRRTPLTGHTCRWIRTAIAR